MSDCDVFERSFGLMFLPLPLGRLQYMMLYPIHACISQPDRVKATIGEKTRAWLKAVEAR